MEGYVPGSSSPLINIILNTLDRQYVNNWFLGVLNEVGKKDLEQLPALIRNTAASLESDLPELELEVGSIEEGAGFSEDLGIPSK